MISYLPCKKCGSGLPIVKRSIAMCPYCGVKTSYIDSKISFKYFLNEILHLESVKNKRNIKDSEIERRKSLIQSCFYKLTSDFNEYRHLIITKLDNIKIDPVKLYNLIRIAGNFEIIIENYLLEYLKNEPIRIKYQEFRDIAYIINKSSLGLYFSYLARNSIYFENCSEYYRFAEKNYQNILDFCNITKFENKYSKICEKKAIYEILSEFAAILRGILNKNPKYYSEKLKKLLFKLEKINNIGFQKDILYTQIESIYLLEHNTSLLLEKIKIDNPFISNYSLEENFIFDIEENLNKINRVRNWIKNISDKYRIFQKNLLKLHSGRFINYLESYRTEFTNYEYINVKRFNRSLEQMINKAFDAYNSEVVEAMDYLSNILHNNIINESVLKKFEIEYNALIKLDGILKNIINNIFQKPLFREFTSEHCKKLVSLISVKHAEFDKQILNYINKILQNFEEFRERNVLSLEEQKNQFKSELKPTIQKLLNLSFNLDERVLSYPLFIDLEAKNEILKQNNPEVLNLRIKNPNLTDIKNLKLYFFMSNSFHSKLKFTNIKHLKSNEGRRIKIKIIPKKPGTSLFMVMAEYQHTNKAFWMPSIKFKFKIERSEQITTYNYYRYNNLEHFQTQNEFIRTYKIIKNYL